MLDIIEIRGIFGQGKRVSNAIDRKVVAPEWVQVVLPTAG
jgi:hypothetical protein